MTVVRRNATDATNNQYKIVIWQVTINSLNNLFFKNHFEEYGPMEMYLAEIQY